MAAATTDDARKSVNDLLQSLATKPEERLALRLKWADELTDPVEKPLRKARIYYAMGKACEYVSSLKEVLKNDPKNPEANNQLFSYALATRNIALGKECVAMFAAGNLDQANGKYVEAQLDLLMPDKVQEATQIAEELVKQHPDQKLAWYLTGQCHMVQNNLSKAEDDFRTALKLDPGYFQAMLGMAMVEERLFKSAEFEELIKTPTGFRRLIRGCEKFLEIQETQVPKDKCRR